MKVMTRTDQGFNKPADRLIQAIQEESQRIDGVALDSKEILKRATSILEERLK